MKTINVSFEDSEMEALKKTKGEQSWHDFILECAGIPQYAKGEER